MSIKSVCGLSYVRIRFFSDSTPVGLSCFAIDTDTGHIFRWEHNNKYVLSINLLGQVLTVKAAEAARGGDTYGDDFVARSFFEAIFLLADNDKKGELVVDDLKTLFQVQSCVGVFF